MNDTRDSGHGSKSVARWSALGLVGAAFMAALGSVVVALINSGEDPVGSPSGAASETVGTSLPSRPRTNPPTSGPPSTSEDREYFGTVAAGFRVDGVVVWPVSGRVRSAGEVKLGDQAGPDERCAVLVEYQAKAADGTPVGEPQKRDCPADKPEPVWPKFGPVYFAEDPRVQFIAITVVVRDKKVTTITCPRMDACHE